MAMSNLINYATSGNSIKGTLENRYLFSDLI